MKTRTKPVPSYKNTKYGIPFFSYKSGFVIMILLTLTVLFALWISDVLNVDSTLPMTILVSLATGFGVAYSQYKIETKRGFTAGFYKTFGLITLLSGLFLWFIPF